MKNGISIKTLLTGALLPLVFSCSSAHHSTLGSTPSQEPGPEAPSVVEKTYKAFTFIQLSDPQLGFQTGDPSEFTEDTLVLARMVSQINRLRPAFVLVTGDMTDNSTNQAQISAYKKMISRIRSDIPVRHLPGNHDVGSACAKEKVDAFEANYGPSTFCFSYENCALIGINSCAIFAAAPSKGDPSADAAEIAEAQYTWLEEKLKATQDFGARIVFGHYPVFVKSIDEERSTNNFTQEERERYWKLFKQYKVKAYGSGHTHYPYESTYLNIDAVTCGALAAPLGKGYRGAMLWTVSEDGRVSHQYLSVDEFVRLDNPDVPAEGGVPRFTSLEGLVMTGYQGWFNTPGDGKGLKWKHYEKNGKFMPGQCSIDLWPDMTEYRDRYDTEFRLPDGRVAQVFSSHDASTSQLHFQWMKQYGIDGAFMQRFVTNLKSTSGKKENSTEILMMGVENAEKTDRAICVMYDLSGMKAGDDSYVIADWKQLCTQYKITQREQNHYLYHHGKPLVAVWGVGFSDGREYGLEECERIIDFLKQEGCSVMLGVPTHWRTLKGDAVSDARLLSLIQKADVVHPWLVGRYDNTSFKNFQALIKEDLAWCAGHSLTYIPTVFPGFSWYNLKGGASPLNQIPRLGGQFLWNQIYFNLKSGAKCLYVAMFDEIDEGTAIFKCANDVPQGASPFLSYEGVPPDRYLWLVGQAAKMTRGDLPISSQMPVQQ